MNGTPEFVQNCNQNNHVKVSQILRSYPDKKVAYEKVEKEFIKACKNKNTDLIKAILNYSGTCLTLEINMQISEACKYKNFEVLDVLCNDIRTGKDEMEEYDWRYKLDCYEETNYEERVSNAILKDESLELIKFLIQKKCFVEGFCSHIIHFILDDKIGKYKRKDEVLNMFIENKIVNEDLLRHSIDVMNIEMIKKILLGFSNLEEICALSRFANMNSKSFLERAYDTKNKEIIDLIFNKIDKDDLKLINVIYLNKDYERLEKFDKDILIQVYCMNGNVEGIKEHLSNMNSKKVKECLELALKHNQLEMTKLICSFDSYSKKINLDSIYFINKFCSRNHKLPDLEILKCFLELEVRSIISLTKILFNAKTLRSKKLFEILFNDPRTMLRYKNKTLVNLIDDKTSNIIQNDQRCLLYDFHVEKRAEIRKLIDDWNIDEILKVNPFFLVFECNPLMKTCEIKDEKSKELFLKNNISVDFEILSLLYDPMNDKYDRCAAEIDEDLIQHCSEEGKLLISIKNGEKDLDLSILSNEHLVQIIMRFKREDLLDSIKFPKTCYSNCFYICVKYEFYSGLDYLMKIRKPKKTEIDESIVLNRNIIDYLIRLELISSFDVLWFFIKERDEDFALSLIKNYSIDVNFKNNRLMKKVVKMELSKIVEYLRENGLSRVGFQYCFDIYKYNMGTLFLVNQDWNFEEYFYSACRTNSHYQISRVSKYEEMKRKVDVDYAVSLCPKFEKHIRRCMS